MQFVSQPSCLKTPRAYTSFGHGGHTEGLQSTRHGRSLQTPFS